MMRNFVFVLLALALFSCKNEKKLEEKDVLNEQTIEVIEPAVVGTEVSYKGDSITMNGYLAVDENLDGKRPGVLVVHEWWGHNEHTRNCADKLAEAGYVALAVDMYGNGDKAEHPKDASAFAKAVMSDFEGAKARFNAALETLKQHENCNVDDIAAIGYCFGGGVVLNMARQGADLDAVATFHGSIGAIEEATPGSVKAQILVMNGADDPFVSEDAIASFKAEMDSARVNYEFVNYEGAVHAFTNPGATAKGEEFELPLAYNEDADKASWEKLMKFLTDVFE